MKKPPIIPPALKLEDKSLPLFLFLGLALLLFVVSTGVQIIPECGLRRLVGIPCPFCGGTRCLLALSQFKWREAFCFNPMVFLTCASILVYGGLCLVRACLKSN